MDIEYYNFMGSEAEPERFYVASVVALRDKEDKVWALETDEFWEF